MTKIAICILLATTGCATRTATATFKTTPSSMLIAAPRLTVAPVIDARPRVLLRTHQPNVARYTGVAAVYFMFGTGRIDGSDHPGDAKTRITVDGVEGAVVPQIDAYLRSVIASATGSAPIRGAEANLGNVQAAARGDGITIVPILDQFDEFRMSSEDEIIGGSTYESGDHQVATSAYSMGTALTDDYANLRLRLVLLETRGGHVVRQATAYIATSSSMLEHVLEHGASEIATQLAAFVRR